ncbi:hypothetical protein F383_07775 [Gossypium arboreum]|uniref:Uncharacterized protein n=1 Tax=Gossypium arboreum TaxID=29729 RepID=A0A0B0PDA8_GOSAR|nr:hypothetical protein F383_07775 [Gossypium arboreum]
MCDTRLCCTAVSPLGYLTICKSGSSTAKAHGRVLWLCE